MRIMVVDGGGRGHALVEKLRQDPECEQIWAAPGNAGIAEVADIATGADNRPIPAGDIESLARFGRQNHVDLTVVGMDDPLAEGIVDEFTNANLPIFGPSSDMALIESSKAFANDFTNHYPIPKALALAFEAGASMDEYVKQHDFPVVVKLDPLAQGKGVAVCHTVEQYDQVIERWREEGKLGSEGQIALVEDYVDGPELSLHAFCDGKTYQMIPFAAQDHKHIDDEERGLMTGGMGTIAPVPGYVLKDIEKFGEAFVRPVVEYLGFTGLLFAGIKGLRAKEKLLEWNARFGDPEAQVFLRLMESPLLPMLVACVEGKLADMSPPVWKSDKAAVCIVLAAEGYPEDPAKGQDAIIEGLEEAAKVPGVQVLHAGTTKRNGKYRVKGGRVLNLVAEADSLPKALAIGDEAAERIAFGGKLPRRRHNLGHHALAQNRLQADFRWPKGH